MLKKPLNSFLDKLDGQQVVAQRKTKLLYEVLDAHPDIYEPVLDESVRSRMNARFRVTDVCFLH